MDVKGKKMNWAMYAKWINVEQWPWQKWLIEMLRHVEEGDDDQDDTKFAYGGGDHRINCDYTKRLERLVLKELKLYIKFSNKLMYELEA
jgi:hypothetical protein